MNIRFEKATSLKAKPDIDKVTFGSVYSDYMFIMNYNVDKGWYDPRIVPFQNISLSPASIVLNYALEIFEGLKAYRTDDGKIQMFRVDENGKRFENSAARMALPVLPYADFVEAVEALAKVEKDWVPTKPNTSLYFRPVMIATNPDLSLHGCTDVLFYIFCSPVGSYYAGGLKCNSIMVEDEDVRAVRGGTGEAKCGGNYGASNRAGERAFANGYSQVLWLDGVEHKYVEEGGGMNVVFKIGGKIVTPMLTGSILPGITRRSCLQLLRDWGTPAEERLITVDELFEAAENGTLEEAMCVGTAAVICPIGELTYGDKVYTINNFQTGPLAQKLYDTLTGIQWGTAEDPHGWTCRL